MATLRELFEGEFDHTLRSHSEASFTMGGSSFRAIEKICWSFDEYSCFLGYFVEEEYATAGFLQALLAQADQSRERLNGGVEAVSSHPAVYQSTGTSSAALPFNDRIMMYVDAVLDDATKKPLVALGDSNSWHVQIRERGYAES